MPDQAEHPTPRRNAPLWVKLFVAFHLLAITAWSLPRPPRDLLAGQRRLAIRTDDPMAFLPSVGNYLSDGLLVANDNYLRPSPIRFYTLSTGFWQYWDMFAPNPASTDIYGSAEIVYRDGSKREYIYPRMFSLGLGERYLKERYRKFYERAQMQSFSYLWPAFAQRVALLNHESPDNPPVTVALTKHWLEIAPPGKPQSAEYESQTYYTHTVDQSKLRRGGP